MSRFGGVGVVDELQIFSDDDINKKKTLQSLYQHYKLIFFRFVALLQSSDTRKSQIISAEKGKALAAVFFIWRLIQLLTFSFTNVFDFPYNKVWTQWFMDAIEVTRFDLLVMGRGLYDRPQLGLSLAIIILVTLILCGIIHLIYYIDVLQTENNNNVVIKLKKPLHAVIIYWLLVLISGPFYIPVMNILLQSLRCAREFNDNTPCWDGTSIGIAVASIFVAIILFCMVILSNSLLIDTNIKSNHTLSMSHSRSRVINVCLETIIIFIFAVSGSQNRSLLWFLTIVINIIASSMLYSHWYMYPYYHTWTNNFVTKTFAIFAWSAVTLDITMLYNDRNQIGGTIFFFIGCVLVMFLVHMINKRRHSSIMNKSMKEMTHIYEIQHKINVVYDSKLRVTNNLLEDENHDLMSNNDVEDSNKITILQELKKEMDEIVPKFSHKSLVYIFQAQMYKSLMENDHISNNCLKDCEALNPPIDCQYQIYKSRFDIEIKIRNDPTSKNIITYLEAMAKYESAVEAKDAAIYLQYRFWTELYEDIPNIENLSNLSKEINTKVSEAYKGYMQFLAVNRESSKALREYGEVLSYFLNDEAGGNAMSERAADIDIKKKHALKNHNNFDLSNTKLLFDEKTAIITISGEPSNIGVILSANDACLDAFGYLRSEVIGNNISMLMSSPFSDSHDTFMLFHGKTAAGRIINTTRMVFGMNKSGFIFPMNLHVKQVSGGLSKAKYLGVIRQVRTDDTEHIALIDVDTKRILRTTASWSRFFNILKDDVASGQYLITQFVPEYESVEEHEDHNDDNGCYRSKNGKIIDYSSANGNYKLSVQILYQPFRFCKIDVVTIKEVERQLNYKNINVEEEKKASHKTNAFAHLKNIDGKRNKNGKGLNIEKLKVNGGSFDDDNDDDSSEDEDDQVEDNRSVPVSPVRSPNKSPKNRSMRSGSPSNRSPNRSPRNRSQDYRSSRNNRDDRYENESRRSGRSGRSARSGTSASSRNDWRNGLARVRELFLNQSHGLEPGMRKLRASLMIVVFVVIIMGTVGSLIILGMIDSYSSEIHDLDKSGVRRAKSVMIAETAREIELVRKNIFAASREADARILLDTLAQELWSVASYLYLNARLSDEHRKLMEIPSINVKSYDGSTIKTTKLNLLDAVNVYQSSARLLATKPLSEFDSNQKDMYFFRANMENILDNLNKSCNLYEKSTKDKEHDIVVSQTILLVITLCVVGGLFIFMIIPAIVKVEKSRKEIYEMFVNELPLPVLKKIKDGAFDHLTAEQQQLEEQNDLDHHAMHKTTKQDEQAELLEKLRLLQNSNQTSAANMEELEIMLEETTNTNKAISSIKVEKTTRRKDAFQYSNSLRNRILLNISVLIIISVGYFFGTYFWESHSVSQSLIRLPEINNSGRMRAVYRLTLYYTRDLITAPVSTSDFYSESHADLSFKSRKYNNFLKQLQRGLFYGDKEMELSAAIHRDGDFNEIMYRDNCPRMPDTNACNNFHYGIVTHGGEALLAEFRMQVVERIKIAEQLNMAANMTDVLDSLTSAEWQLLEAMDDLYMNKMTEFNAEAFVKDEDETMSSFSANRRIVIAFFAISLCVLYIIFYKPLVKTLDTRQKMTRGMLLMVPTQYMMSIPAIAKTLTDVALANKT